MRSRTWISLVIALAVLGALAVALFLRAKAPPEAARLLPESDAILYVNLKPLRAATHFDQTQVPRSADLQRFIDETGIVPERDLEAAALALHRMQNPRGPNGPVAYSEVFVAHFDGQRLAMKADEQAPTLTPVPSQPHRRTYAPRRSKREDPPSRSDSSSLSRLFSR